MDTNITEPADQSELEKTWDPDEKIYSANAIRLAAFLGGPMAGAYMLSENYKTFGEYKKGRTTIWVSLILLIVLFVILLLIPESENTKSINRLAGPFTFLILASLAVRYLQKDKIDEYASKDGKFYKGGRSLLIVLVSAAFSVIMGVILVFLLSWTGMMDLG
jgi:chromate transport protein ChrA